MTWYEVRDVEMRRSPAGAELHARPGLRSRGANVWFEGAAVDDWLSSLIDATVAGESPPEWGCTSQRESTLSWQCDDGATVSAEFFDGECDDNRRADRIDAIVPR